MCWCLDTMPSLPCAAPNLHWNEQEIVARTFCCENILFLDDGYNSARNLLKEKFLLLSYVYVGTSCADFFLFTFSYLAYETKHVLYTSNEIRPVPQLTLLFTCSAVIYRKVSNQFFSLTNNSKEIAIFCEGRVDCLQ